MQKNPIRVYVDTCVFGGAFDIEFAKATQEFFAQVKLGNFHLITSALVLEEIEKAPTSVQECFRELLVGSMTVVDTPGEAFDLQQAYLDAGIVTSKWADDALHVATATVTDCALIISWNFKHIVHFQKIPLYNAVNITNGYRAIAIHSPFEVLNDDER